MATALSVFISGAHSVGKTTLVTTLENEPVFANFKRIPEIARRVIKEKGWTRENFDLSTSSENFKHLNLCILQECFHVLKSNENVNALLDRGPDPLVYIRMYVGEEEYLKALKMDGLDYCLDRFRQGKIFILEPCEQFITDDSVRLVSTIDELWKYTNLMYKTFHELSIPYHVISETDLSKRTSIVTQSISNMQLLCQAQTQA